MTPFKRFPGYMRFTLIGKNKLYAIYVKNFDGMISEHRGMMDAFQAMVSGW